MGKVRSFLQRHAFILLIVFGLLVAGANYLIYPTFIQKDLNLVEVPVATTKINETTKISEQMISTVKVTQEVLDTGIITSKEDIVNKYVANDCTIPSGSFFYKELLTTEEELKGKVARELNEGEFAFTFALDPVEASTGVYKLNQNINLYGAIKYKDKDDINKIAYGQLVGSARIIAMSVDSNGLTQSLTIAVTEDDLTYINIVKQVGEVVYSAVPYQKEDMTYGEQGFLSIDMMHKFINEYSNVLRPNEPVEIEVDKTNEELIEIMNKDNVGE